MIQLLIKYLLTFHTELFSILLNLLDVHATSEATCVAFRKASVASASSERSVIAKIIFDEVHAHYLSEKWWFVGAEVAVDHYVTMICCHQHST